MSVSHPPVSHQRESLSGRDPDRSWVYSKVDAGVGCDDAQWQCGG